MSEPRLRGADLAQATTRSFQIQALLTPERMQGPGFAFALIPSLRRLYPVKDEFGRAMTRHLATFATHPILSGYVLGATARLEERRADGDPVEDGQIDSLKRSLASPLAALGDPLFWVTLRPLAGLVGVLAIAILPGGGTIGPDWRVLLCPFLTLLTYNAIALRFRISGVSRGYAEADHPGALLRSLRLAEWEGALSLAGALGYGALLALVALSLELGSDVWSADGHARVSGLIPLLIGGLLGYALLRRWPGRGVELGLGAFVAAAALAAGV